MMEIWDEMNNVLVSPVVLLLSTINAKLIQLFSHKRRIVPQ